MNQLSRKRSNARWPFWLLIVAWVCANSPQAATYAVMAWLGEARHFTHQQRLTSEVAQLLTGVKAPESGIAAKSEPTRPPAPAVPAEATLKKIELVAERTAEVLPVSLRETVWVARAMALPDARRAAPPHEPPRARLVA